MRRSGVAPPQRCSRASSSSGASSGGSGTTTGRRLTAAFASLVALYLTHLWNDQRFNPLCTSSLQKGKGETIMACDFPNPGAYFSANVYLDRHCSEHYNICVDHANKLNVPLFIGTGSGSVTLKATCDEEELPSVKYTISRDGTVDLVWKTQ